MSRTWSRVVLVTGMPRTGTTVVAAALAGPPAVIGLHEPFNPLFGLRDGPAEFHVPPDPGVGEPGFQRAIDLDYRPRVRVRGVTGTRTAASWARARLHRSAPTLVLKDPTAPFLLLAEGARRGFPVVVMVRRPDAVLASYRRLGLDPRPGARHLAGQGLALTRWGVDAGPLDEPATDVEAVGLLWRVVAAASSVVGAPLIVRHEDLLARPVDTLHRIEEHTGLGGDPDRVTAGGSGRPGGADRVLRVLGRRQTLRSVGTDPSTVDAEDRRELERALCDRHRAWYPDGLMTEGR